MNKERLDVLVQRRAGVSRSKAQGLIRTGKVLGPQGRPLDKPGQRFEDDLEFTLREGPRYVSRGGDKLEAALKHFALDPTGHVAIDVGASTGGFTDCLLKHGAQKVYAVDVGYGQLHWQLREDPRVVVLERTNIRHLTPDRLDERPTFFTADCSFISLRLVLPPLQALLAPSAEGVLLIKPQFETQKEKVGKKGVVTDPRVHEEVIEEVTGFCRGLGFTASPVLPSPLLGPAGNREFLAHVTTPA